MPHVQLGARALFAGVALAYTMGFGLEIGLPGKAHMRMEFVKVWDGVCIFHLFSFFCTLDTRLFTA